MEVKLKGADIDKVYREIAVHAGVEMGVVKKCVDSFFVTNAKLLDELEVGEEHRIYGIGIFKRVKRRK